MQPLMLLLGVLGLLRAAAERLPGGQHDRRAADPADPPDRRDEIDRRAARRDIVGMYLVTVLASACCRCLWRCRWACLAPGLLVDFFAGLFNFDISTVSVPPLVLALEVGGRAARAAAGRAVAGVGRHAASRCARRSAAMGWARAASAQRRIDRLIARVRFLSRPMLLSLRNTFRRKGRLALTLSTLTLAGAIFMAVMSVRESLNLTAEDFFTTYNYDATVFTERPYRVAPMLAEARDVPGVVAAEGWGRTSGRRVLADRTKTENIDITALPPDTKLFQPP